MNYRKHGSASYSVLEVRSVREREREIQRERERERDGSDVTLVALNLAKSFALFLAKNLQLSFCPLKWHWVRTFPLPKTLHSSKQFAFFIKFALFAIAYLCQMASRWQGIEAPKQMIEFPTAPSFSSKNESNLYQKLLEIEKKKIVL